MAASPATPIHVTSIASAFTPEQINKLLLEPFKSCRITWRVDGKLDGTNGSTRVVKVVPYASIGDYYARLNEMFGTEGWDEMLTTTQSTSTQREKYINGRKSLITTCKIVVSSTITIRGLSFKSMLGEAWADDENGARRASAQATRGACGLFGLGEYFQTLYESGQEFKTEVHGSRLEKSEWPHFSVLPDYAIHPDELEEAIKHREAEALKQTQSKSTSSSSPHHSTPSQNQQKSATQPNTTQATARPLSPASTLPAVTQPPPRPSTTPLQATAAPKKAAVTEMPKAVSANTSIAAVNRGVELPLALRTPEIQEQLLQYREQLSDEFIMNTRKGIWGAHSSGKMKGETGDPIEDAKADTLFNLDLAVGLVSDIEEAEPNLPDIDTLPGLLEPYKVEDLSEIKCMADLKAVHKAVLALYEGQSR